ncbi:MAG TPA: hypothetical protein PKE64_22175 [Anaerolineae bacterium]|nr:hypothetical protein [Anaerolineae bacterium]HMR66728.1 hypothetical protein [Anaerolineae bacterium]
MLQLRLDATSAYNVRMPRIHQQREIIELTRKFVTYERTRPHEEQTPLTNRLAALLEEAMPYYEHRESGELQRTTASEAVKRLDEESKLFTHQIWTTMNFFFKGTPERAKAWGFEIRQSTRQILKPKSRTDRLALLTRYAAREESLPEHERFSVPELNEVKRVRDELARNLSDRNAGRTQREVSIIRAEALADKMYNHLQYAAVYLLAEEFEYTITPDLEHWGFDVVMVRTGNGNGHANGNGSNGHDSQTPA